jgi:hypothetical protein
MGRRLQVQADNSRHEQKTSGKRAHRRGSHDSGCKNNLGSSTHTVDVRPSALPVRSRTLGVRLRTLDVRTP